MPKASSRPSLPTSSTDFALPPSSSIPTASTSALTLDDATNPLLLRFRRPSLLAPKAISESRLHSPLASSFTLHSFTKRRGSQSAAISEESESDRGERMWTDSSPSCSSENPTPPLRVPDNSEEDLPEKGKVIKPPLTPPRRRSSVNMDQDYLPSAQGSARRLPFPVRSPQSIFPWNVLILEPLFSVETTAYIEFAC